MKVYIGVYGDGYEGEHSGYIVGAYSTSEKAIEVFTERANWEKAGMDDSWEWSEREWVFCAAEKGRSSRDWIRICIVEREVE